MPVAEKKYYKQLIKSNRYSGCENKQKISILQNKNSLSLYLFQIQLREKWIRLSQRELMTASSSKAGIGSLGLHQGMKLRLNTSWSNE